MLGAGASNTMSTNAIALLSSLCGLAVYLNSLDCGFCFDDLSAVTRNEDLHPDTPWSNLVWHDFWGTPMAQEGSHKSYRPLCVATFRLNYLLHGLEPFGYHLVNLVLHSAVCYVFTLVCSATVLGDSRLALVVAGVSFAVHPVHTEAVAGVVGRAECLSSLFFLMSFLSYQKFALSKSTGKSISWFISFILLSICSVLSKEQGITVLAVCLCYEFFILQQNTLKSALSAVRSLCRAKILPTFRNFLLHAALLTGFFVIVMTIRVKIMKAELPVFTIAGLVIGIGVYFVQQGCTKFNHDNPGVQLSTPYRQLHWLYLIFENVWLLLNPAHLCADWTMGTVPLVDSLGDPRNILTLLTMSGVVVLGLYGVRGMSPYHHSVTFALSLMIFPFLPASNLLFPVGFVVAERILYVPSMGFAILLGTGVRRLCSVNSAALRHVTKLTVGYLLVMHSIKTMERNRDWLSDLTLFTSAIRVNPQNGKLYNNLGHEYERIENRSYAEFMFRKAIEKQPDDIGSYINLGRVLNAMERAQEAEEAYRQAITMMPTGKTIRVAPPHINVYYNLANLVRQDSARSDEALQLYSKAISMKKDFVEAFINKGDLLLKHGRHNEAKQAFLSAIEYSPRMADAHFNLGSAYLQLGERLQAEKSYQRALAIDGQHGLAMFNLGMLYFEKTDKSKQDLLNAKQLFETLVSLEPTNDKAHFQLGMVNTELGNVAEAMEWFYKTIDITPSYRTALYNLALLSYKMNDTEKAFELLQVLRRYHPDHVNGMQLLGDMLVHRKEYQEAKEVYLLSLQSKPDHMTSLHNLGVVEAELGNLQVAIKLFSDVLELDPHHSRAKKHLQSAQYHLQQKGHN